MKNYKTIPHYYTDIQGWTTFENLYKGMVNRVKTGSRAHFVEMGVWRGRSAAFMGVEIANSFKNITFDAIDTFSGSEEHLNPTYDTYLPELADDPDYLYKECVKNLEPVKDFVNIIRGTSLDVSKTYQDESLDFIFIDGSHRYEDVLDDLKAWYPKVKVGGYITGHDISYHEVYQAVTEFQESIGLPFYSDMSMDIWFHTKPTPKNRPYPIAYSQPQTVDMSYEFVLQTAGINGDIVECGVAAGAQIIAFSQALEDTNQKTKRIHAFDSFEGIPLAGPHDTEQPGIGQIHHDKNTPIEERLKSSGVTVHSLEEVRDNFIRFNTNLDNVYFYPGWFQHTLPQEVDNIYEISILRLDGDLYESTLICLEYLYDKVVPGGIVIIDDYGLEGCYKALVDFFKGEVPETQCIEDTTVHWFRK